MEEFKVGDKVRVKKNVEIEKIYNKIVMYEGMITKDIIFVEECYPNTHEETVFCSNGFYYGQDALTKVK